MRRSLKLFAIVVSAALLGPASLEAKHARPKPHPVKAAAPASVPADLEPAAKIVHYGIKDVVRLNTKVRFTTLIELPQSEQILDVVCGDRDLWVVNGNQNFAYVKPAKEGITTNLNLIELASQRRYLIWSARCRRFAPSPFSSGKLR